MWQQKASCLFLSRQVIYLASERLYKKIVFAHWKGTEGKWESQGLCFRCSYSSVNVYLSKTQTTKDAAGSSWG